MKTVSKLWLLLSLMCPSISMPAAAITVEENCALSVAENKVPKTRLGMALTLDSRQPLSPSFQKYLYQESLQKRNAHAVERAALALAYTNAPTHRVFQSNDDTFVKYNLETRELLIVAFRRVVFYDRIPESEGDWFNGLRKAKARADYRIEKVQPFEGDVLRRHFESHGHEFGVDNARDYERLAMEFAESSSEESITLEMTSHGRGRWVKVDFATREIVVVGQDTGCLISYYKREHHPHHYVLRQVKLPQTP